MARGAALRPVGPCSQFPPSSATNGHAQPDPHWPSGAITAGARPASRASLWRRGGVEWRSAGQGERGRAGCLSQAARPLARTAMKSLCFNPRFFKRSFSSKSTEIRTYFRSMNKPSLPGTVVTTRITGSHYRIMLSLPEQCVITTACRSHYQMPLYSLCSAVITTRAMPTV